VGRWPTNFLLKVVTQVFLVFRVIVSEDYAAQKSVLQKVATEPNPIVYRLQLDIMQLSLLSVREPIFYSFFV
jgi:hypothetical protein